MSSIELRRTLRCVWNALLVSVCMILYNQTTFSLPGWTNWVNGSLSGGATSRFHIQEYIIRSQRPKFEIELSIPGITLLAPGTLVRVLVFEDDLIDNQVYSFEHEITANELLNGYTQNLYERTTIGVNEVGSAEELFVRVEINRPFPYPDVSFETGVATVGVYDDDTYEPNNSFSQATYLGSGSTSLSNVIINSNDDYYRVTVSAPNTALEVRLALDIAGGNLDLRLYNSGQQEIAASTCNCSQEIISQVPLPAGTYFVRVQQVGTVRNWFDLSVVQLIASQPILSVTPSDRPVSSSAGSETFSVQNTGSGTMNWNATSNQTWAVITSGSSGTNNGTITVGYTSNISATARVASVNVTAPSAQNSPRQVSIIQLGVTTQASQLSMMANPASIQFDGSSTSLITATLRDQNGNPVSGQVVNFELSPSGLGGTLNPEFSTTGANGSAQTVYSPDSPSGSGQNAVIGGNVGGVLSASTTVQVSSAGSSTYRIDPQYRLLSRTANSATYELDPYVTYTSSGLPVEATNITISTSMGLFQNIQQTLTDVLGDSRGPGRIDPSALLTTTSSGVATITYTVGIATNPNLAQHLQLVVGEVPQVAAFIGSLPSGGTDDREPEIGWAPDGTLLAVAPGRIWRFPSLNLLYDGLTAYSPRVLSFSKNARKIISDRSSTGFCLYNLETSQLTLGSPSGVRPQTICWSDQTDDVRFAIANNTTGKANEIIIFTGDGFVQSFLYTSSTTDIIRSIDWKCNYLAAVTEAGVIYLFNTSTMSLVWSRSDLGNPQKYAVKISPDCARMVVLGRVYSATTANVQIFTLPSSTPDVQFVVPSGVANSRYYSIDWSPDGTKLVCGGDNGYLRIIDAATGIDEYRLTISGDVYGVRWSSTEVIAGATSGGSTSLFAPFDNEGPTVAFQYPPPGFATPEDTVTIAGVAKDGIGFPSPFVEYSLNGSTFSSVPLTNDTMFIRVINLSPGQNDISVRATDRGNRQTIVSRTVFNTTRSITVTSPNPSAVWYAGHNETVVWTSVGVQGNVRIELSTNGGVSFLPSPLVAITQNDGSEFVQVPLISSSSCKLKVVSIDDTIIFGLSSGTFGILSTTDVGEGGIPVVFSLSHNYPNPWNPSTTIRYALPQTSFVALTVFNMLGQQVVQLVNEQQEAGYHNAVFRGQGLASGVYFYRLHAGEFVQTKRMLLLK